MDSRMLSLHFTDAMSVSYFPLFGDLLLRARTS